MDESPVTPSERRAWTAERSRRVSLLERLSLRIALQMRRPELGESGPSLFQHRPEKAPEIAVWII